MAVVGIEWDDNDENEYSCIGRRNEELGETASAAILPFWLALIND